jgi:2-polyprenyl-3-methyl-5-hydroxy-6-metoxy-1,4-benzoquinol methylase
MYNKENLTKMNETDGRVPLEQVAMTEPDRNRCGMTSGYGRPNQGQHLNLRVDSITIPNLAAVKAKQKATWESGDFGRIARTIENVAEEFMARQHLERGSQVLDVACGTGNLAVIAARQSCAVRGIDIAANLIGQARTRVTDESLQIDFREGDAEAMPFHDSQFDLVVSMFGVMFTPQPNVAAAELRRVTKP